ncbi:hypothetical protein EG68_10714 [Paragonimus skrjabini miyazakii]|uniref:Uncharacterized protein n=1 Tax=Paragonimus skrjabini miyazakii TaxID=59628 RepID=A0A8S9YE85_9TREM|nr:hypothetical protein EG68_10714 [Paragonimus skrjabini miyazakii]
MSSLPPRPQVSPLEGVAATHRADNSPTGVPYHAGEVEVLLDAMRRATWIVRGETKATADLDKQTWMQIANYLSSHGWPKRTWQQIKAKGKQLLLRRMINPTADANLRVLHPGAPATSEKLPFKLNTSVMNSALPVVEFPESIIGVSKGEGVPKLPTLTPSPSLISTSNTSTAFDVHNHPQIVHVRSDSASSKLADVPPASLPSMSTTYCPPVVSSLPSLSHLLNQETMVPPLLNTTSDPSGFMSVPWPVFSGYALPNLIPVMTDSASSFPQPGPVDFPASLPAWESEQKARIYALKLEVLSLKRQYWLRKLRSV